MQKSLILRTLFGPPKAEITKNERELRTLGGNKDRVKGRFCTIELAWLMRSIAILIGDGLRPLKGRSRILEFLLQRIFVYMHYCFESLGQRPFTLYLVLTYYIDHSVVLDLL